MSGNTVSSLKERLIYILQNHRSRNVCCTSFHTSFAVHKWLHLANKHFVLLKPSEQTLVSPNFLSCFQISFAYIPHTISTSAFFGNNWNCLCFWIIRLALLKKKIKIKGNGTLVPNSTFCTQEIVKNSFHFTRCIKKGAVCCCVATVYLCQVANDRYCIMSDLIVLSK